MKDDLLVDLKSGDKIEVKVKDIVIGGKEKVFISGPCSVEDYVTMKTIAKELKNAGVHMLRGGAFKPRTSPYDFQGLQYEGLKILKEVSEEENIPFVTEIMDTRDVERSLDYVDMIQIGSRNMYNYSLLKEVGKTNKPVLLKRGMSATLAEWLYAAEYIMAEGNMNVVLCERGIRTFENYTRNTLDLNSVAVAKQKYRLPIIVDPSHGTGLREIVYSMSLAAIAVGADGLMIESHISPDNSVSDSRETISVDNMKKIIDRINTRKLF
ncbi:3-deoxy-7-phosphoheptulonate synthase [Clostridium tetanomorphum]|uniref:3-deoxy-7-phosphoheptulonate synthase n=1 Tax=Clostridium tetanomorphum TaxID=1553 RepID=A0A923IZG2_CLOTT|nr:3-deoxy-7-phosphoheptulonate synthase [Clostridium tetanomorphum]KAJ53404.1 3-deoxy-7-phosphoheptulonate synthase [Clostridium tetanomorphum DSM 665]MBC2396609.1 3-deoxy-7-phosphoheptulonate synthase [Clostridium tetanomorphum]MBP1863939.1 3-deoxy-7-phosphoheptulonate synthase [Clostridium tetanomorphum]NRS85017.1 3-deoxy-7-phosphoheptulonate synthase [Clostridium tetanomorphum]NRZ98233.1 3-deoxy-7-phosphoheptulonate synthase [Clostridium tetanomorphum]